MIANGIWVLTTTLGLAVGGLVLHFPGSFGDATEWQAVQIAFGAILGFVTGALVGVVQWIGLRLPWRQGMKLLLAMGLAIGATHGLNDGAPFSLGLPAVSALSASAVAVVTWWLLAPDARATIASSVGWTVGLVLAVQVTGALGLPAEETPMGWAIPHVVDGIVVGIGWGIATAAAGLPARLRAPAASVVAAATSS